MNSHTENIHNKGIEIHLKTLNFGILVHMRLL